MTRPLHKNLDPQENHMPYALGYTNAADRMAGENEIYNNTTLSDDDVGKISRQTDKNSYWMLIQVTPCVKWVWVGGPNETTQDMTIYLNGTTGSDTGNGTATYPFATFDAAINEIPKTVAHIVKILVTAGTYTSFPETTQFNLIEDGVIVIDASGETYPVVDGPFTITTVNNIGTAGPNGYMAVDIVVSGESWSADEFYGKYIRILTGGFAGRIIGVVSNTSDTIRTTLDLSLSVDDTFEIIECPVIVNVPNNIFFNFKQESFAILDSRSDLVIAGIRLNITATSNDRVAVNFSSLRVALPFTTITGDQSAPGMDNQITAGFSESYYNINGVKSGLLDNENLVFFFQTQILPTRDTPPTVPRTAIVFSNSTTGGLLIARGIISIDNGDHYSILMTFAGVAIAAGERVLLGSCYVDHWGLVGTDNQVIDIQHSVRLQIHWLYLNDMPAILESKEAAASIDMTSVQGTITKSTYAIRISRGAFVVNVDGFSIVGTSGAVDFLFPDTQQAAWPASGDGYNDGYGTHVVTE